MNIGFGLVVIAAVAILLIGAGATWYADANGSVATVNGVNVTRNDYRTRYTIERWRFDQAEARLRDEFNAGHITQTQRDSGISAIESQRQSISTLVLERLIDGELQRQLATEQGITVTDADIDARLQQESTHKEQRHLWMIEVTPETSEGATEPTAAQTAAAKAKADAALADLKAGKAWEDVAKATSTGSSATQGGDLGWATADANLDETFRTALFAAAVDTPTDVIEGSDGVFRIGRVSEIAAQTVDQAYSQKLADAGISMTDYRTVMASDLRRTRLGDKITAGVVDTATAQRRVSEIYMAESQGAGDEVKVRHILYSPNDITDQTQLQALPTDDPAWEAARVEAQAAYDKLKAFVGSADLTSQFETLAKAESDEPGADTSGGELPYFTQDQVDRGFGDAIFADGLKAGDLVGPVQSQYGWHVILFEDRRADPQSRIESARIQAAQSADFATLAKQVSEGTEASKGGDLGWIARYQLDKTLEDAIFATPVGSTSDVVEVSGDGFYIFKVTEEQTRKPDGTQAETLKTKAFSNWYAAQKDAATIERQSTDLPTVTS
jgi:parvulin-like peptidyl-prolyl isomerase